MTVLHTDHDPNACAWLEELTRQGHLAGSVLEADITKLKGDDLRGYDRVHLFAGIGGWEYALQLAGWPDGLSMFSGSAPCQPFSQAGKQLGVEDKRHLWPEMRRLIADCRPSVVVGEQVASPAGRAWLDNVRRDLSELGYDFAAADLCAASVGAPHIRQRLYWIADLRKMQDRKMEGEELNEFSGATDTAYFCKTRGNVAAVSDQGKDLASFKWGDDSSVESIGAPHIRQRLYWIAERVADKPSERRERGEGAAGPAGQHGAQDRGADGRLADGPSRGLGIDRRPSGQAGHADECGTVGGMDHTASARHAPTGSGEPQQSARGQCVPGVGCEDGELANADGWDSSAERQQCSGEQRLQPSSGASMFRDRTGSGHGGWTTADWLHCRDGKWRPAQPGTFPLVARLPKSLVRGGDRSLAPDADSSAEARAMRLKGYGNSIVPQVAAEFLKAYLDTRRERWLT